MSDSDTKSRNYNYIKQSRSGGSAFGTGGAMYNQFLAMADNKKKGNFN